MLVSLELELKRDTERLNRSRTRAYKLLRGVLFKFEKALFSFLLWRERIFLQLLLEQKRFLLINTRLDRWFTWTEREVLSLGRRWLQQPSRTRKQRGNDSQEWGGGVWPQTWR